MVTPKEIKTLFDYCPETGVFTLKVKRNGSMMVHGDVVGSYSHGYLAVGIRGRKYSLHRLAFLYMTGLFPQDEVDHINHVKSDNRWINLRQVNHNDNGKNQSMCKNNTSGVNGVSFYKPNGKWRARITINGVAHCLGYHLTLSDAEAARKAVEIKADFHNNHGVIHG